MWRGNNARDARLEFENAKIGLVKAGLDPQAVSDAALTQSYLRLEQPINAVSNIINFPVLNTQTGNALAVRATEKRLNLQDAFYCAGISFYICKTATAGETAMKLNTYPDPLVYTATGEANGLYVIYNGFFQVNVNNTIIVPAYPMSDFLYVPITQSNTTNATINALDLSERLSLQPNPVFIGQKQSLLSLIMPNAIPVADATVLTGVFILHGVLAQNVTVVS